MSKSYCLQKGGYDASEVKVDAQRFADAHHSICVFSIDGVDYVIDNGKIYQSGIQKISESPYGQE